MRANYLASSPLVVAYALAGSLRVDIVNDARCLVRVGDSITTDHISSNGAIHPDTPAGTYLQGLNVSPGDFNSLGSRRGNHEVMMRGTFPMATRCRFTMPACAINWKACR